ncbi:unnamed protein product [Dovyalis caffra]|uniref:Uncharacterized protein n=1 Tax=Dovyalis caffra TaxID=77055 RepID=A0AAV1S3X4_9ROSI|nr:unnamed protein product [Dovyalis caffra]
MTPLSTTWFDECFDLGRELLHSNNLARANAMDCIEREREKDLSRCLIRGQPARYVLSFSTIKTLISSFPSFASRRAYSLSKIAER